MKKRRKGLERCPDVLASELLEILLRGKKIEISFSGKPLKLTDPEWGNKQLKLL